MVLSNAALEQLDHKIKEEEIITITVSAKAEGVQAATWAAECAEQKQQYPSRYSSRTLCYYVSLTLQAPQAVKMEKQENREIRDRKVQQLYQTVHFDQRGVSRGTVQSWHGKQCCQEAPRNGCSEQRPGEAVRQRWRRRHNSTYVGN